MMQIHIIVLVLWMAISFLLMMDRNRARGYSIAILGAVMLLPSGAGIELSGFPDLEKISVAVIGCLFGTAVFQFNTLMRFRPCKSDFLLVLALCSIILTSLVNKLGLYAGVGAALAECFKFVFLVFLARLHLSTPRALRTFLYVFLFCAVCYVPLVALEWRFSPQSHYIFYGYFQHEFSQFKRWGFFRPVGFFPHALDLGRFLAFAAFLAALPLRRELGRVFPMGHWLFVPLMSALLLTMSFGPYIIFGVLCAMYYLLQKRAWLAYVPPVIAMVLVALLLAGFNPFSPGLKVVNFISTERGLSLQYRIDTLVDYSGFIMKQPVLGYAWWAPLDHEMRATDSQLLIRMLKHGMLCAGLLYAWWFCTLSAALRSAQRLRGSPHANEILALAALIPLCMALSTIDSALDPYLIVSASAMIGIDGALRSGRFVRRGVPRPDAALGSVRSRPSFARQRPASTASREST